MSLNECAQQLRDLASKVRASWSYQECGDHRDQLREIAYQLEQEEDRRLRVEEPHDD